MDLAVKHLRDCQNYILDKLALIIGSFSDNLKSYVLDVGLLEKIFFHQVCKINRHIRHCITIAQTLIESPWRNKVSSSAILEATGEPVFLRQPAERAGQPGREAALLRDALRLPADRQRRADPEAGKRAASLDLHHHRERHSVRRAELRLNAVPDPAQHPLPAEHADLKPALPLPGAPERREDLPERDKPDPAGSGFGRRHLHPNPRNHQAHFV